MNPQHQYSLTLEVIEHKVEQSIVQQRKSDGYINATALCKAAGKLWHQYRMPEVNGQFRRALAAELKVSEAELIQEVPGGAVVWVHPQVAVHLAQWLSPQFAVKVTGWVQQWMSGGQQRAGRLPPHIERHMLNFGKVPPTHFSILQEMTNMLVAPMEAQGYTLPEEFVPDISQGLMFCRYLRDKLGIDTDAFDTYLHEYPDGRKMPAKLYPIKLLSEFRTYINEVWLPGRAADYFGKRDPAALLALDKVLKITYQAPVKKALPRFVAPKKAAPVKVPRLPPPRPA